MPVNVFTITDGHHQDYQCIIVNSVEYAIVANPNSVGVVGPFHFHTTKGPRIFGKRLNRRFNSLTLLYRKSIDLLPCGGSRSNIVTAVAHRFADI